MPTMQVLGQADTLAYAAWPSYNEKLLVSGTFNLPVQVRLLGCSSALELLQAAKGTMTSSAL